MNLALMYVFGLGKSYIYVIVKNIFLEIFDFWSDDLDKERAKHTQILGVTGCGKSSLVEYLIDSNIRKKQGFLLVEPHGELAYRVLHNKRFRIGHYSGSFKNLVYLDFDNNPPAFNIFRLPLPQNPTRKQVFIDGLSSDIADALSANMKPKPSDAQLVMLRNLLIGCFLLPDATFLDIIHFLKLNAASDNRYCQLINCAISPVVRDYFENDFLTGNNKRTREALRYRLNNLVIPRQLYLSLCSESCSVQFDKILSEGKFVVVRASISLLGEYEAVSIGNLIHNLLSKYAFERMAVGDDTSSFFIYFDEAQYYMNQTVQKSLTGTRKTGMNYTLSHHELSQGDMTAAQQRTARSRTLFNQLN